MVQTGLFVMPNKDLTTTSIELYQFGDSPCCMKVRMALAEKKLPWGERFIRSWQFDHHQPDYLEINPHGTAPTLVHNGQPIIHSNVILEYLDEVFPDPVRLKPSDPMRIARMRQWMADEQDHLFQYVVVLSFNLMMKLRVEAFGMDQLTAWSKRIPDQARAQDYLRRVTSPPNDTSVMAAQKSLRKHIKRLDREIEESGGPWVCGENFTLADICLAPIFDRIEWLDLETLWDNLPRVTEWYGRVQLRPSFVKGVHPFAYRMWGPRKSVLEHPFNDADYPA